MIDFNTLRKETEKRFAELAATTELPDTADIDYFFIPSKNAEPFEKLAEELTALDFIVSYPEEGEGLIATLPDQVLSAYGIWMGEELATRLANRLAWEQAGWAF